MRTNKRSSNKSITLRRIFKWTFIGVACSYLAILIVGGIAYKYSDVKIMMQEDDTMRLHKEQIQLDRQLNKIIPDFFSSWTLLRGVVVIAAAFALLKIQSEEEQYTQMIDNATFCAYQDIHYTREYILQQQILTNNGGDRARLPLVFKPYQVQKAVLIFKDYKFKSEIMVCVQVMMLALIASTQYCLYGIPYLLLGIIQLLTIALSHGRSDQNIRIMSAIITVILIIYLPVDLVIHYMVHLVQESERLDEDYDAKYYDMPSHYQLQGYQGIMATTPSYVTFSFKIILLVLETMKYKYSYDMSQEYDYLRTSYTNADSKDYPQSFKFKNQKGQSNELGFSVQKRNFQGGSGGAVATVSNSGANPHGEGDPEDHQTLRLTQKDNHRKQHYNMKLKLQYIRIFRKSQSFVHKILKPISLFMLSLTQLIFLLCHTSVLFIIILVVSLGGFFIDLKDYQGQNQFVVKAKIALCIEVLYVAAQYYINIYKIDGLQELQKKEELTILIGIGTQQQLGYYEDEANIFDTLFPFNFSVMFLLFISLFTRYMGKPRIKKIISRSARGEEADEEEEGRGRSGDTASQRSRRRGPRSTGRQQTNGSRSGDDDMLTVLNDDNMSISGYSDLRSQRSRRSSNFGGGGGRNFDTHSQHNVDLYQNIIEEEEDENDNEEGDDVDDLDDHKSVSHDDNIESQGISMPSAPDDSSMPQSLRMSRMNKPGDGFDAQNTMTRRQKKKKERHDPQRDSTFRGKIRIFINEVFKILQGYFNRLINISIVHINKLVLLFLFLVSVSRPTLINVVLFIMFLILSMVNHQNEFNYLRLTLFFNSAAIVIMYTFDVFIQRDFSTVRTWVLIIIGVQYRHENVKSHIIKIKYLPYVILQVILVLSAYIFQSDKYQHFKSQYMDIENQKQQMIAKQINKRFQALTDQNLSSKASVNKFPTQNSLKSNNQKSSFGDEAPPAGDPSVNSSIQHEGGDVESQNQARNSAMSAMSNRGPASNLGYSGDDMMEHLSVGSRSQGSRGSHPVFGESDEVLLQQRRQTLGVDPPPIQDLGQDLPDREEGDELGGGNLVEGGQEVLEEDQMEEQLLKGDIDKGADDETRKNLMKQQEMIVMYDPASKFIIKHAAYFLIFFLFIEVVLLPLSIMNIILLILMTVIVVKMLYCETRIETYRSLALTLQILSVFAIIYIFTKYMFLFTQYTQNIQLKNSIENNYHQHEVNEDGTVKHGDLNQEQQKTEDARNQLHHSHDEDDSTGKTLENKILQKIFGFQKTEDQKNEGGSLLSFKLLNLAIVLSLTNLQLNILRHRNLPFLLGEKDKVIRQERSLREERQQSQQQRDPEDSDSVEGADIIKHYADPEEKAERINRQKILINKKLEKWKIQWRWWHYTKVYLGFGLWFSMPLLLILLTFLLYPLSTASVPSLVMIVLLLILMAYNSTPSAWRQIHQSIGTLVQIMICACYVLYFMLLDQMTSYDQNNPTERQQFQNMKVFWGLYQSSQIIESQSTGQADDVASILTSIIPLFLILAICFLYKELDKWYQKHFNLTIHLDGDIKKEVLRFQIKEDQDFKQQKTALEEQLKRDMKSSTDSEHSDLRKPRVLINNEAGSEDHDKLSLGTLGAGNQPPAKALSQADAGKVGAGGAPVTLETDKIEEESSHHEEADIAGKVLQSLEQVDLETVAQCRGEGVYEPGVTNQFLVKMIKEVQNEQDRLLHYPRQDRPLQAEDASSGLLMKGRPLPSKAAPEEMEEADKNTENLQIKDIIDQDSKSLTQQELEEAQEKRQRLNTYLRDIIECETPYRHCFFLKNHIWTKYIAMSNALNLLIYFGIYAILNKMNLISLFYWLVMWKLLTLNFRPNIFKPDNGEQASSASNYNLKAKYGSAKNKSMLLVIKLLIALISTMIVFQLAFSVYTNIQFSQQEDMQRYISNNFCPNPQKRGDEEEYDEEGFQYETAQPLVTPNQVNKECAADWSYYLFSMPASSQSDDESQQNLSENQESSNISVSIDLIFLVIAYLVYFVASGSIRLTPQQMLDPPVINDHNDFVTTQETKGEKKLKHQTWRLVETTFFVYLPYFLIVYLMYASSTFNGRAMSDLLSSIYLWFALRYIINIKKVFSKNTKLLKALRFYNRIVLSLILLYQMPVFLCPSAVDVNGYTDPDYINTEDCAAIMHFQSNTPPKKQYEAKPPMQLYIILSQSIGLFKQNYVNMTFLGLFFITEVQYQIFVHPHFKEYVVKHMVLEKESDGKVRAFMYVERFHLNRLWAYRAIKEEIKILHKILVRLNDQISKSDFAKNLAGFVEYQQKSINQSNNGEDESKALLEDPPANAEEEKKSEGSSDLDEQLKKEIETFIDVNSHVIDGIALMNLSPDKVVIPLKRIVQELKLVLWEDIRAEKVKLEEFDEESLTDYINRFIKTLDKFVVTKNRVGLYHKEGLGLSLALDAKNLDEENFQSLYDHDMGADGCSKTSNTKSAPDCPRVPEQNQINRQSLYSKLYKSYNDAVEQRKLQEKLKGIESPSESEEKQKSSSGEGVKTPGNDSSEKSHQISSLEPESSSSKQSNEDFNPSSASFRISEEEQERVMKNMTWAQQFNYQLRLFLWQDYIDHILFMHLQKQTKDNSYLLKQPRLEDYGLFRLLEAYFLSNSPQLVMIAIIFNFFMNANLLSLFIVLTVLCYSILENPLPSSKFWKFMMSYVLTVISLKFLYQLPLFCGTPVYTFYDDKCSNEEVIPQTLSTRIDYLIGIHKFSGPASYPRNVGTFFGIFADIVLLMVLLLQKQYLSKIGAWNYVKNEPDIYKNPSFSIESKNVIEDDFETRNLNQQADLLAAQHERAFVYEQSGLHEKVWFHIKRFAMVIINFYGKVLPQYMHRKQENTDSRKRLVHPYITHKFKKVKPGQDYFTEIFFTLLLIIIYTLIYWKNISGEDKAKSFGAATVSLDRFSTVQVISLFLILILLLFERMLYRARYIDERDNFGKFQSQARLNVPETNYNLRQQHRARKTSGTKHTLALKLLIYYTLIGLIHVYLGFFIPRYQIAPMYQNPWLVLYYIFWCFYFYYSALQIKHGYPMAPYKQAFSHNTSYFSYLAWRTYKAIPFIWEMKVIIDWTVTSTCLDLYQWFKLDDAYNTLYYNQAQADQRKQRPEFQQRNNWEKIFQGFCFALGLIFVILAPIFLFSGINPIMVKNPIKAGNLQIELELIDTGNSYKIFETKANRIAPLETWDDASWRLYFEPQSNQIDFQDMQKVQFNTYSDSQWTISPPSLRRFINDFKTISKDKAKESEMIKFKAQWTFIRDNPTGKERTDGRKEISLTKKDFLPVIEMLERDSNLHQVSQGKQRGARYAQVSLPGEEGVEYDEDAYLQVGSEMRNMTMSSLDMSLYPGLTQGLQIGADPQMTPLGFQQHFNEQPPYMLMNNFQGELPNYEAYPFHQRDERFQGSHPHKAQAGALVGGAATSSDAQPSAKMSLVHQEAGPKVIDGKEVYGGRAANHHLLPAHRTHHANASTMHPSASQQLAKANLTTKKNASTSSADAFNSTSTPVAENGSAESNVTAAGSENGTLHDTMNSTEAYEYESEQADQKSSKDPVVVRKFRNGKAQIAVKDAFPKLIRLNAQTEAKDLDVTELQPNTSRSTSMELQLNRQGDSGLIYYWTFSLGSSDGRGGKNHSAYFRDTPGVFNSRNSPEEIQMENRAEKRKQSTSKIEKKQREMDKAEMARKKVQEEQNLVILIYNEEVIGSFFGNALQLSVVGLYATIVIAIGRFIRIIFDRISQRVMYEELPNTRQLFEICEGIFIAQQEGDLVREKQLYDLLILMYRSPEALIKMTGTRLNHREEEEEDNSTQDNSDFDSRTLTGSGSSVTTRRKRRRPPPSDAPENLSQSLSNHSKFE